MTQQTLTLRVIFDNISNGIDIFFSKLDSFFTKLKNLILDFNLGPLIIITFFLFVLFFGGSELIKRIKKEAKDWSKYHIGQKIVYPIYTFVFIIFYFFILYLYISGFLESIGYDVF